MDRTVGRRRDGRGGWCGERENLPGRRLFVAVPLPNGARQDVVDLVERVRRACHGGDPGPIERHGSSEVRWVDLEGLHLTLRFLGPTTDDKLPAVSRIVQMAAGGAGPFEIRLQGGGAFPSLERPRALWLGVVEGQDALTLLAHRLEEGFVDAGWPPDERPYRAHLTLARSDGVRSGPRTVSELVAHAEAFSTGWHADRITLFESHTGHGPARYEALVEAPLES